MAEVYHWYTVSSKAIIYNSMVVGAHNKFMVLKGGYILSWDGEQTAVKNILVVPRKDCSAIHSGGAMDFLISPNY